MTPARVLTFAEDLPADALSALAANGAAAWLIDVAAGRIPAANTAGSALLGLDCSLSQPVLDASMPALVRLRALARESGRDERASERLIFWNRTRAVRLSCRIAFLRARPHTFALVTAFEPADEMSVPEAAATVPPFSGTDAARLKEIARRIREGHLTRLQPAPQRQHEETKPPKSVAPDVPFSLRSSLAHELKTPVGAIAAAAEIMQNERFGPLGAPRYLGYARNIHDSAQHVLSVIDRMLAEGRTDPEALRDLDITEVDIEQTLAATVSQLVPLAERAGIALALELTPRLPHVIADATSLRQIVFNLVTNALKFTDPGGQITVAARYSEDGHLSIVVADTGSGMAEAEIEKVLAPSGAAGPRPRVQSAKGGGLGLGLPLVRALAAANGAELRIDSTPGKGTSASVVFEKGRAVPV